MAGVRVLASRSETVDGRVRGGRRLNSSEFGDAVGPLTLWIWSVRLRGMFDKVISALFASFSLSFSVLTAERLDVEAKE